MKKISEFLTHRLFVIVFLFLIQLLTLVIIIWKFSSYFVYFYIASILLSLFIVLAIVNSKTNPAFKIAWIIPILLVPIFGGSLYLLFGGNKIHFREKRRMEKIVPTVIKNIRQDPFILRKVKEENVDAYLQMRYMSFSAFSPVYEKTESQYLKIGEDYFKALLEELRKAQHYIFMEYFIIHPGKMWDQILEVLTEKVKEGVEVRLIYDDLGCITTFPKNYQRVLEESGIKWAVFNRFMPVLTCNFNNRDHRKITVIDGIVGFTGGINLADEYINAYPKYGHWKDNGILLKGDAVWSLTVMFLSVWDSILGIKEKYASYQPKQHEYQSDGYIQPYSDGPSIIEAVSENVYLNLIQHAKHYLYITTPYLIVGNELITALCNAAKSGVDVRIITPGIPDKKTINEVTKAYYDILLESGVEIYEYEPGFMHAKMFVADDLYATIGTVNLDFRSLYLHFECGVFLYRAKSILEMKKDFKETLLQCRKIEQKEKRGLFQRLKLSILKIFAPLM